MGDTRGDGGPESHDKYLTYSSYLRLDDLLSIQVEKSGDGDEPAEHDEMLFIIIHQVYELWFKQVLHELDYVRERLARGDLPRVLHSMKRILTILKVLVAQLDILETMTPLDFLAFRVRLAEASGLQSYQFRELEFLLGNKREEVFDRYPTGSDARARIERRFGEPTLWDAVLGFLDASGYPMPASALERDVTRPIEPSPEVQVELIRLYRSDPQLVPLCERLIDLDEGLQEWRYRHVKMVERTIGSKHGTGGTTGAPYLATSLNRPIFPDLWAIRTSL
jgi:tryptophan 2,3-dioxygenase